MARYRKVDVRVHNDSKFRALSPIPPCGQGLWLRLLTGPEMSAVPGAIPIGEMAMAEALGWDLEAFREAFREVSSQGMAKADWQARLIWVPKAINYNRPQSVNVVKSWSMPWDELPECDLKVEAYHTLKAYLEGMDDAFLQAFRQGITDPSPKARAIHEHEHEHNHEHKKDSPPPSPARETGGNGSRDPRLRPVPEDFQVDGSIRQWAQHLPVKLTDEQIDEARDEFVDYWRARGDEKVNWRSAFMEQLKAAAREAAGITTKRDGTDAENRQAVRAAIQRSIRGQSFGD